MCALSRCTSYVHYTRMYSNIYFVIKNFHPIGMSFFNSNNREKQTNYTRIIDVNKGQ